MNRRKFLQGQWVRTSGSSTVCLAGDKFTRQAAMFLPATGFGDHLRPSDVRYNPLSNLSIVEMSLRD
jgi:hypothetical protein